MTSNYQAIQLDNVGRYGTEIERIGRLLLTDRYDKRAHFIFELLQNAEDALGRRKCWNGSRTVTFTLTETELTVSHYGNPFDERDVLAVCGIAESTKAENAIGRFGIGFKSVYSFTERPEIHSGDEHFAIEKYVQPHAIAALPLNEHETQIVLRFKAGDSKAFSDIHHGLKNLGATSLLFLRNIESISWSATDGSSGDYLRSEPESLSTNVNRVTVLGNEHGKDEVDEQWLVFDQTVRNEETGSDSRIELAFSIATGPDPKEWRVQPVLNSLLVVFFPTVFATNLGFLIQGPYRTTPSRDNIFVEDLWNQHLAEESAELLGDAVRWLRDNKRLDIDTLRCLPLERGKFANSMFLPLFDAVRSLLIAEPLLPTNDGSYASAKKAKLGRTQEVRDLLSSDQLSALYKDTELHWLSGDITRDRASDIRIYLTRELSVAEITPESIVSTLTKAFLELQNDDWISSLYLFLSNQPALRKRLDVIPLVRLESGLHVRALENGQHLAFLSNGLQTDFPLVKSSVCKTPETRSFLEALGVTEPNPVDDVIRNVLPRYRESTLSISDEVYASDIERLCIAFKSDSVHQKQKLISTLSDTTFVQAVATLDESEFFMKPSEISISTERLRHLFAGIDEVHLVDESVDCLRGEAVRTLLEACGAHRCPRPTALTGTLDGAERARLRTAAGHARTNYHSDRVEDWDIEGLEALINALPRMPTTSQAQRAEMIWESLRDLSERRGVRFFNGTYSWSFHGNHSTTFPAAFIRLLNTSAWVVDKSGILSRPDAVSFEAIGWKPNPFLEGLIIFQPPLVAQLARELGFDPEVLGMLKEMGVTSSAQFKALLGIKDPATPAAASSSTASGDDARAAAGNQDSSAEPTADYPEDDDGLGGDEEQPSSDDDGGERQRSGGQRPGNRSSGGGNRPEGHADGSKPPKSKGRSSFTSYIAVDGDADEDDPDDLDHETRMTLEESAIKAIVAAEPLLRRTPSNNPGYDLYEEDDDENAIRWVEVKAMTGAFSERPVGLSHTQFEAAMRLQNGFWLYIVEHAGTPERRRIIRIHNPAGNAKTFTFDSGWEAIDGTSPIGSQQITA